MAIILDKQRKQYYIAYRLQLPNGEIKQRKIRNKEWTKKSLVKNIELEEIEKDKKKVLANYVEADKITLATLFDLAISDFGLTHKKENTYGTGLIIKNHIAPFFDTKSDKLNEILSQKNLIKYTKALRDSDRSEETYNRIIGVFKMIIEFAVERDFISSYTYAKSKVVLKKVKVENQAKEKLVFWTPEQYQTFIDTFKDHDQKWKVLFDVTYFGALRIGEVLALTWGDFNPTSKTISINKTLDRQSHVSTTKNASSNAPVDLPTAIVNELIEFKKEFPTPRDTDYIFFMEPTSRSTIRRVMDDHIKEAGLPHMKFHGLRHSMASRMINKGCNALIVSKHLRHASTQQTLDTYAHLFPKITAGIMDEI
jgi:integrase